MIKTFNELFKDKGTNKEDSLAYISEYLSKRFLYTLNVFENYVTTADNEKFTRKHSLLSLGEIMRFMGTERITPFRFKIFTLLNSALATNEKYLKDVCVKVWNIYVHTVDILQLGPLLSSIIVALRPLIDEYPNEVDEILTYLLLDNGNLMSVYFQEIFFLDEIPIRNELKQIIMFQHKRDISFMNQLDEYLRHIRHENIIVRGYGLKYLGQILKTHRTDLNNLIINENVIHPVLGGLLRNLMLCCKENDTNLQRYAAECLGELGAFEPSHLPPDYKPHSAFAFSIHSDDFAIMAIRELCRAYQVQVDSHAVDCASLAIQEILIANNVNPTKKSKINIWEAIPEKMRPLIEPLLNSSYTTVKAKRNVTAHPIFGSFEARTCEDWAFNWATKLISKISKEETRNLLDSFKPIMKRDMNTLALIFPYIVLHSIQSNSTNIKDQKEIYDELNAVLEGMIKDEIQPKKSRSKTIEQTDSDNQNDFFSVAALKFSDSHNGQTDEAQNQNNIDIKCAKIVFGILDFLERYLREFVVKYNHSLNNSDFKSIEAFLKKFDPKTIALANYHCEEYARALWYIENYIMEDANSRLEDESSLLAKIHADLFDPDSVEGVMAVKTKEAGLHEQILLYNVTGRLHESATCFERMMQARELTPKEMKNMVECYIG